VKTIQKKLKTSDNREQALAEIQKLSPQLVLAFGSVNHFGPGGHATGLHDLFPEACVIGCSTAGEIANDGVYDDSFVVTAAHFSSSKMKTALSPIKDMAGTLDAGVSIGRQLNAPDLKAIFVLGRGLDINGSALIQGIRDQVGPQIIITGGLAGDAGQFKKTFTVLNQDVAHDRVVAFGIYGKSLEITFGSRGGWDAFGPIRTVTRSKANVLFELDGKPALDIYKQYLGDKIKELPASGLLFPFQLLKDNQDSLGLVRTILSVDEKEKSLTLAGDIPQNGLVRLMHTTNEGLVAGAKSAAELASPSNTSDSLGILISCVGRKIVMGVDVEDELEAVREVFKGTVLTGFYSYGEICPQDKFSPCSLHNQTMTITCIREAA